MYPVCTVYLLLPTMPIKFENLCTVPNFPVFFFLFFFSTANPCDPFSIPGAGTVTGVVSFETTTVSCVDDGMHVDSDNNGVVPHLKEDPYTWHCRSDRTPDTTPACVGMYARFVTNATAKVCI